MPRFSANLSMLFTEAPFLERFERAARSGFKAVEFLFPYDYEAAAIRRLLDANGLKLVLHNLPAGDWAAGERGIACLPDRTAEFRAGVAKAVAYATALDVPQVNCLIGKVPAGVAAAKVDETVVENLRYAAAELKKHGLRLVVEALNTFDTPGFYLHGSAQTMALIDRVGSDNLFFQYDIYHMQRMEGEIASNLSKHLARIKHVQLADNPGRHEPGTGELNYRFLFEHLDKIGYAGWVGCEYKPTGRTEDGLGWIQTLSH